MIGGGLIRSLGGWAEVKRIRQKDYGRLKADERILGDSDFVMRVLSEANEKYDRQYELKRMGYDLKKVEKMVTEIYQIDKDELSLRGRHKTRAEARSLFCYWAVRELGISGISLARRLGMSQSGVVYAVNKGEKIAKEKKYKLLG